MDLEKTALLQMQSYDYVKMYVTMLKSEQAVPKSSLASRVLSFSISRKRMIEYGEKP